MKKRILRASLLVGLGSLIASCAATSSFVDSSEINKKFPEVNPSDVKVFMTDGGSHANCQPQGQLIVDTTKSQKEMWTTVDNSFNSSPTEIKKRLQDGAAKVGANLVMNVKQNSANSMIADAYHC
ncbi:hypothetical protein EDC55_1318 [Allofrancisella inopinata]|uniref:hypothetical protein n=1 Tax=Allofrancisella inopinata TaxID=1085647 RepID=UPI0010634B5C|nr:hypothetical protein [Allofrancisella inopinata]TDT66932.1 hypothetical protein EDC55_1318 [Allofrancisella inopinata]